MCYYRKKILWSKEKQAFPSGTFWVKRPCPSEVMRSLTAFPMIVTSSYQDKTGNPVSVTVQIPYRYEKVRQASSVHFPAWAVLTSIHPLILGCHGKKGLLDRSMESPCVGKPGPVTPLQDNLTLLSNGSYSNCWAPVEEFCSEWRLK